MNPQPNDPLLDVLQRQSDKKLLSVYMTAGFPRLEDTRGDVMALARAGVDFLEIGIPFSDPLADGPVIQQASSEALRNGMSLNLLFDQLAGFEGKMPLPALLMGYVNPVMSFGAEKFCQKARAAGISGVILPDLPMREYLQDYKETFQRQGLHFIFLITPTTPERRIRQIDEASTAFIYVVGSSATTGSNTSDLSREAYLQRLQSMNLKTPLVVGFGINGPDNLHQAWKYAAAAITGTAYVRLRMKGLAAGDAIRELYVQLGLHPDIAETGRKLTPDAYSNSETPFSLTPKLYIP